MPTSIIALIILALVLILLVVNKIPPVVTILLGMLAMTFTGCMDSKTALSGFGSTAMLMNIGMNIVGACFFTTGISAAIGRWLYTHGAANEKAFLLIVTALASALALFINPMAVISIFMPIIDSVAVQSNGRIRRKMIYLPCGAAAIYGGTLTAISTSTMVNAGGMLESASGQTISFFQPALLTAGGVIAMFLMMATFGYKLMDRCFDFEEPPLPTESGGGNGTSSQAVNKSKAAILVVVLIACIYAFIFTKINMAMIALTAASVLMVTGCISVPEAFKRVSWVTAIMVGACISFGSAMQSSGAGELVANSVINVLGSSSYMLCAACMIVATLLSNLMANNGALVIVAPIAIALAQGIGADVLPFVMATAVGANYSISTVLANSSIAITAPAGYRFKDFLLWGGLVNLVALILGLICLKIFFF